MESNKENNKGEESHSVALKKSVGRYEDEIMSLVDSRPYAQTTITNFDNLTSPQKFTSCHELLTFLHRPVVSPESKLRNLERSPLFILREKPKTKYSSEFREKAIFALLYDPTPETLAPFNQCKTEICNNYDWDEDDDDIFASISTQEILHQDVKISNFPHMSKFPVTEEIIVGTPRAERN
ncbi:hypothetical protein GQX74_005724 [Glossina fuscipes]|nr:hypothetical protein GQX74_005724 [Glossina fuscipes]